MSQNTEGDDPRCRAGTRENAFQFERWSVKVRKSHILQSFCSRGANKCKKTTGPTEDGQHPSSLCTFCRFEDELELPQWPEMLFADNFLLLSHESGVALDFNPLDALKTVNAKDPPLGLHVASAGKWREARQEDLEEHQIVKPFDWTYSTDYLGTLKLGPLMTSFVPTSEKIDMEKLKLKEPILFYDEIHLYEDELADNGCALCTVKIRVMASGWFALLRFYLRVDHVLIRVRDTRLYYPSGSDYILRESSVREDPMSNIQVPPTVWRDPNQVWPHLTLVKEVVEKLTLPS